MHFLIGLADKYHDRESRQIYNLQIQKENLQAGRQLRLKMNFTLCRQRGREEGRKGGRERGRGRREGGRRERGRKKESERG